MESALTTVGIVGLVIVVAALLSAVAERRGVPLVAVFIALGALLGPWGLGLADFGLESPALRALATLGLALVLFSDAVTIDTRQVRSRRRLVWRLLGPGTLLPAAVIAIAAWFLLDVPVAAAVLLGAALASTDPVLLRSVIRSPALPESPRIALRLESGMNDAVLLPVVVVSMLLLEVRGGTAQGPLAPLLARHAIGLFLLGPALGALIGWLGIVALAWVRERFSVRRDYESLYALGLALSAFAAAEMVGGSGFLAAFTAGLMVSLQDVELCDCFLEYGQATAEMLLLLTFVALGTSPIWSGLEVIGWRTLLFALVALGARTVVLLPMLRGVGLAPRDRRLIALFGPRGLSSLLFVLLPVFAGAPGATRLFALASLVVLLSVVLHGGGISLFLRANTPRRARSPLKVAGAEGAGAAPVPERSATAAPAAVPERMDVAELKARLAGGDPLVIVDARADRSYGASDEQARGAVRLPPDDPVRAAADLRLAQHATLVVYCA